MTAIELIQILACILLTPLGFFILFGTLIGIINRIKENIRDENT